MCFLALTRRARFLAAAATLTASGSSVWFTSTTDTSAESPKFKKRGSEGRIISGNCKQGEEMKKKKKKRKEKKDEGK